MCICVLQDCYDSAKDIIVSLFIQRFDKVAKDIKMKNSNTDDEDAEYLAFISKQSSYTDKKVWK